ncbi:MAG TPA: S4 domain-containing protein, partial [Methylomirabilota bacterium]|nr:S4 domain-containing protein [Methylomirabilota bacterium]
MDGLAGRALRRSPPASLGRHPATVGGVERRRIDTLLTERGLAGSRTTAAASVRAGRVRIGSGGARATKPGQLVAA